MNFFRSPEAKLARARFLCSLTWILMVCWPNNIQQLIAVLSTWSIYFGGLIAIALISILTYLLIYWFLMRWTARVYLNETSYKPRLLLQTVLIILSLLAAYLINQFGSDFVCAGLCPPPIDQSPAREVTIGSYLIPYFRAWITVTLGQLIALRFSQLFLKSIFKPKNNI